MTPITLKQNWPVTYMSPDSYNGCPWQAQSALDWGNRVVDDDGVDSQSDDEGLGGGDVGGSGTSNERRKAEEATKAAEAEARETAEEKRLRLARDVLMKLDAEQREQVQ